MKRVYRSFEIKNLGKYHELYLRSDVILLTNVFENFRKVCLEIYELNPAKSISAPGFELQTALKKTEVELNLVTY